MASPAGWVGRISILALIASAAWFYGGVEQWFQSLAAALLAAVSAFVAAAIVLGRADCRGAFVAAFGPAGMALIAVLQLSGGGVSADAVGGGLIPRTLYPAETRLALASFLAVAAAAFCGTVLFRSRSTFVVLLSALLLIGATTSVHGMGLRLSGEDRFIRGEAVVGDPFAHFVNRNNAAGFLQICLAAGLAWLSHQSTEDGYGHDFRRLLSRDRAAPVLIAVTGIAFCAAGIIASRSRGGTLAALVTIVAAVLAFGRGRRASQLAVLLPPVLAAAGLLVWLGLGSAPLERFRIVGKAGVLSDGRFAHWQEALTAIRARPLWGGGAGAYAVAYSEFATHPSNTTFQHADGQFIETAVESGIAGSLVLVTALGAVVWVVLRSGSGRPSARVALTALAAGQLTHALFDFAVVLPAVAATAAVFGGAAIAQLCDENPGGPFRGNLVSRLARGGFAAMLAGGLVWAATEHTEASAVDRAAGTAERLNKRQEVGAESLDPMLAALADALGDRPDDAEGHRALAMLWVRRYELAAAARLRQADEALTPGEVHRLTSLVRLHRTVNLLARSGATRGVDAIRADGVVAENLVPARRHYEAATVACPRLPAVWLALATLRFTEPGSEPGGTEEVAIGSKLFPAVPRLQRSAARLAWQAGDRELAGRCWRRAFSLDPSGIDAIITELSKSVGPDQALELTLPEDPDAAVHVIGSAGLPPDGARAAYGRKCASLAESGATDVNRVRLVAMAAWFSGDDYGARRAFEDAVTRFADRPRVWADAARFHFDSGNLTEAVNATRVATALGPADPEVRRTAELINRNSAAKAGTFGLGGR